MIRLAYVSVAREKMRPEALLGLLRQCQRKNATTGVTGLLLFGNGTFLQVLEGEAHAVDCLFHRIEHDHRHRDVRLLSCRDIEQRRFPDWKMGFRLIEPAGAGEPVVNFDAEEFSAARFAADPQAAEAAIDFFSKPYWDSRVRVLEEKESQLAYLESALANMRGCLGIATLVLQRVAEATREGRLSDAEGNLCALALDTIKHA
jgi:hypothetical protein